MSSAKSMSGITCDDNCIPNFKKVSKEKVYRYVIFRLTEDNKLVTFDKGGENFEDFRQDLIARKAEPCFAAYDFHYKTVDGHYRKKIAFLTVCSDDDVSITKKMLYTSTKPELISKLGPSSFVKEVQINDFDDLDEDYLVNYISNNKEK